VVSFAAHATLPTSLLTCFGVQVVAMVDAAAVGFIRQYRHGRPLGEGRDVILDPDGQMIGIGAEPDDSDIDTGCTTANLNVPDRVLVWWYGLWWSAPFST